jgi:alpha-glucosidase (family GH31 glycosyl hydrolase)
MPKWAYGFLQCKNRYMNRQDLIETGKTYRDKHIPCDGLIIDWLWFSDFGDLTWREDDWPDAEGMLQELNGLGFHVSSAQHPFISEHGKYYNEYRNCNYLNIVPETKRITYDHTNPEARRYWWNRTKELYEQGLRGYWIDMGELEEHFEGTISFGGDRTRTHNAYSYLWSKALYEGQRDDYKTRPFILSRSGCIGIQKFGTAVWSGDIDASWKVLADQVVIGQGMAMSGVPHWTTDIGGFYSGKEFTPELYLRWAEWGAFCGVFRTHGTRPENEAWSFGIKEEELLKKIISLRYRLLPYIYSLADFYLPLK